MQIALEKSSRGRACATVEETTHRAFGLNAGRKYMNVLSRYLPLDLLNLDSDAGVVCSPCLSAAYFMPCIPQSPRIAKQADGAYAEQDEGGRLWNGG